jgi:coenzyme F420-0:L-glutamate ligase / coenzyme F420-1:gamma-L-glutamate ligase
MPDRNPSIAKRLELRAIGGLPLIAPGDDLAAVIAEAAACDGTQLQEGDVVVVAQKIVSKAENRIVKLESVTPSPRAIGLAAETDKDARIVELILRESSEILRQRPGLIVAVHRRGWVLANAGIDQSNVGPDHDDCALLLPADPDNSAAVLRENLRVRCGVSVGVIVNDSLGRAWRLGTVGTALGVAGLAPLLDLCGKPDLFGRRLKSTVIGHADEIAAAASLLQGQANEGAPVVIVRGLAVSGSEGRGNDMIRKASEDLFR